MALERGYRVNDSSFEVTLYIGDPHYHSSAYGGANCITLVQALQFIDEGRYL